MKIIPLAILVIFMCGCGAMDTYQNDQNDSTTETTQIATPTPSPTPKPTPKPTPVTSSTNECNNTAPVFTVTSQPSLPLDFENRIDSWPLIEFTNAVNICKTEVIKVVTKCQTITSALLDYAETTCGCVVIGIQGSYYYSEANLITKSVVEKWSNWCAYRKLVKGYLTDINNEYEPSDIIDKNTITESIMNMLQTKTKDF